MPFPDLEIHIFPRTESGYPIHIRLGDSQDFAGELTADLVGWPPTGDPAADGQHLFAALFADPKLRRAWDVAYGQSSQRRICLWLDADAPELHVLPWELLHDGTTWLAADAATPFSRYLPSETQWGGLVTERPIRILSVISNPTDLAEYGLPTLDVDVERKLLTEALGDLVPNHFQLEHLDAPVTLERLEKALASDSHVLHFVGHGTMSTRQEQAALYLQDETGNTEIVTDAQLSDMLRRQEKPPHLIFLAACQTAERSTADAFAGLAPKLVQAGIPAVVAMQDRVSIQATHTMTPVFYEALARHGVVDRALNAARSLLLTTAQPDVAAPALYMRLKDAQLWEPLWAKTNPYRGLAAFTEDDAAYFFGREKLITELSQKARRQRFIAVVGPSGSGKSSVVQAGLLPTLSKDWQIIKLRPDNDPYANEEGRTFIADWQNDMLSFVDSQIRRFVIFVDQFEELFALCTLEIQTRFLNDLQGLIASSAPVTVILTLRADFYGHLQNSPLGKQLEQALVNVLPMEADDLRAAIAKPAQAAGLRFEAGLVKMITKDAQQAKHTLPLLQFALAELWERQMQRALTYEAYEELGRVAGAIGLWAEDTYNGLTPEDQQLTQRIFTRLVHYGEGDAADTRQRRTLPELLTSVEDRDALHRLLQLLANARLLVTGEAQGTETVEIIHDALLQEWSQLALWLTEKREFYLWRQRLEAQINLWVQKDHDDGALLRGALLVEAERWLTEQSDALTKGERDYIQDGVAAREREREMRERRRRRTLIWVAAAAVIFFVLSVVAGLGWLSVNTERQKANEKARIALARQLATQAQYILDNFPEQLPRAVLLAVESLERYPETASTQVLRQGIATMPREIVKIKSYAGEIAPVYVDFSPQGDLVVSGGVEGAWGLIQVWEVATGDEVAQIRHQGFIKALQFSPDGRYVASGATDNVAKVWEVATGRSRASSHHNDWVTTLDFSPDEQWVVSGSADGVVRIWETNTGKTVSQFTHANEITIVAFGSDGQRVISGSEDGVVKIWDIAMKDEISSVDYGESISFVDFTPDGAWAIAAGFMDGDVLGEAFVRVWDVETSQQISQIAPTYHLPSVALSNDGQWIASSDRDTVMIWEVATGSEIARLTYEEGVSDLVFSPDGRWLAGGGGDGTVRIWEAASGKEVASLKHDGSVSSVAFGPNAQWLISGSRDGTARLWDISLPVQSAEERGDGTIKTRYNYESVFSPGGHLSASISGSVLVRELETDQVVAHIATEGSATSVAFSPNEQLLAIGDANGTVQLWDLRNNSEMFTGSHGNRISKVLFSPDGQKLASISDSYGDNTVIVWDVTSGNEVIRLNHSGKVNAVAFSPDGKWIASGGWDDTVHIWEITTGNEILQIECDKSVNLIEFSPSGNLIAFAERRFSTVGSLDESSLGIWNITTNNEVLRQPYVDTVSALMFSSDSQWLVVGSEDGTVRVWKTITGNEIARMTFETEVTAVAFNSDEKWVVSGTGDGILSVWEIATTRELMRVTDEDSIKSVSFSHDDHYVISASNASTKIRFWRPDDLINLACSRLTRNLTHAEWTQYLGDEPYRATCPNLPIPEE